MSDINKGTLLEQIDELKQQLKTEFDTGYKLGAKEAKGEIDKLRKEIEEINSYIPNISTKALTTSEKLKIAVDALKYPESMPSDVYDLRDYFGEWCEKARQALEKIGEL